MKNQERFQKQITFGKQPSFQQVFLQIFNQIFNVQQQLDALRQLLNQQISFNLKDLYVLVSGTSTTINYKHILNFIKQSTLEKQKQNSINLSIQSMIRFYNGQTSLNLSFTQFSAIFLNRKNRLLMKMTLQRDSIGTLPNYILNFSKKILCKQIQLHCSLLNFRKKYSRQAETLIQSLLTNDQYVEKDKIIHYLCQISNKVPQKINVQFQIFQRYLKPLQKSNIQKQVLINLLTYTNTNSVTQYLKQKSKKKASKSLKKYLSMDKTKKQTDPFVRPQFHDCLARPKMTDKFSYRQVKSIQKHLDRLTQQGCIQKDQITSKIKKYQSLTQKNCQKVLEAIKDIIWLQKQIQFSRVELNLCPDFYPVLFFECFHKDKQNRIIPSAMQIYFKQFGIKIPLNEIYLLFKRYAWHLEGKMDFNSFCSIFDVCQSAYSRIQKNRQVKSLGDVDVETKKNFLLMLATVIKNQKKIDLIKLKLQKVKQMSLRDVFACLDTDDDGYLSITDFRVVWKKYYNLDISKQMLKLLWFRMGFTDENQIIRYQQFIKQMIPKSNKAVNEATKLRKIKSQSNLNFTNKTTTNIKLLK